MFGGVLRFGSFSNITSKITGGGEQSFDKSMSEIENGFSEYASLIYDGPFSEHVRNRKPRMIQDAPQISEDEAKARLMNFIGADKVSSVEITGESNGDILTYSCTASVQDRQIYAEVTKNGGHVLLVLDERQPEQAQMEVQDAAMAARDFLARNGYQNMFESYYQREGNTVLINYAFKQGDYVIYTDLIKVKIALDTGEMIGFEAHGYITNHLDKRQLPAESISEGEARGKVNSAIEISDINKAMIPLENGKEVFCYELKGRHNDKNFLVYINVENGNEEKILILLENENGTLTI